MTGDLTVHLSSETPSASDFKVQSAKWLCNCLPTFWLWALRLTLLCQKKNTYSFSDKCTSPANKSSFSTRFLQVNRGQIGQQSWGGKVVRRQQKKRGKKAGQCAEILQSGETLSNNLDFGENSDLGWRKLSFALQDTHIFPKKKPRTWRTRKVSEKKKNFST